MRNRPKTVSFRQERVEIASILFKIFKFLIEKDIRIYYTAACSAGG